MLTPRKTVHLLSWPDPLTQERLEDMDFFFEPTGRTWIRFCDDEELATLADWLKKRHLAFHITLAKGRGELKRLPKLSDELVLRNGGGPTACALCGARGVPCRQWIEGDDTDSVDYPGAARFFLCGKCVQTRMQPHPRLYAPAEEAL